MWRSGIMDGFPDRGTVVMPFPGYSAYAFAFDEEGPAYFFFLVHSKHPFPPVTGFSSSIPDSPRQVGGFSAITKPNGGCFLS